MQDQKSGITDNTTQEVVVLTDDKITLRANVKVYGVLEAGLVRTTEIIADQRYEKQFLEFANPSGNVGSGLLWTNEGQNRQFVLRNNPDRFWATESIDIPQIKTFMIGGNTVLGSNFLGNSITASNLQALGNLKKLDVSGPVNFADTLFFNPHSGRLGIGIEAGNNTLSVYDATYDVEMAVGVTDTGNGKIGTQNTKSLDIVTDNQIRINIDQVGNVTVGHENRDNTVTKIYGKLSVGIKNPKESLEVSGNIRWSNKLFQTGDSIPDSGTYQKGDIVWNTEPKPNTYIGWVCTTSGTPGLWRPFGLISA
jgi:hypothetical protein